MNASVYSLSVSRFFEKSAPAVAVNAMISAPNQIITDELSPVEGLGVSVESWGVSVVSPEVP